MNNYPPGVTGNEFEITWPDFEREMEGECPKCHKSGGLLQIGFKRLLWIECRNCNYVEDIDPHE